MCVVLTIIVYNSLKAITGFFQLSPSISTLHFRSHFRYHIHIDKIHLHSFHRIKVRLSFDLFIVPNFSSFLSHYDFLSIDLRPHMFECIIYLYLFFWNFQLKSNSSVFFYYSLNELLFTHFFRQFSSQYARGVGEDGILLDIQLKCECFGRGNDISEHYQQDKVGKKN